MDKQQETTTHHDLEGEVTASPWFMVFDEPRQATDTEMELKDALFELARIKSVIKSACNGIGDEIALTKSQDRREGLYDIKHALETLVQ